MGTEVGKNWPSRILYVRKRKKRAKCWQEIDDDEGDNEFETESEGENNGE